MFDQDISEQLQRELAECKEAKVQLEAKVHELQAMLTTLLGTLPPQATPASTSTPMTALASGSLFSSPTGLVAAEHRSDMRLKTSAPPQLRGSTALPEELLRQYKDTAMGATSRPLFEQNISGRQSLEAPPFESARAPTTSFGGSQFRSPTSQRRGSHPTLSVTSHPYWNHDPSFQAFTSYNVGMAPPHGDPPLSPLSNDPTDVSRWHYRRLAFAAFY